MKDIEKGEMVLERPDFHGARLQWSSSGRFVEKRREKVLSRQSNNRFKPSREIVDER